MADLGVGETALLISSLAGAGAAVYSAENAPKPPALPKLPDAIAKPKVADTDPLMAQKAQQRANANGRQSTLLTGPGGLLGSAPNTTTLLGG
jgi:hypothetical protein